MNDRVDERLAEHLPAVRAYIRLRMGARVRRWETESDIAQSVCREALAGIDRIEYRGPAELRHWLFQAALRKIVEKDRFLRAEKRDVDLVRTNAVRPGDDESVRDVCRSLAGPSQVAIGREALERIESALDDMADIEREVVLRSRLAGQSTAEIAEALDRTEAAIRGVRTRALVKLAAKLAE